LEKSLTLGIDFEDPDTYHSMIRDTRFSGCTGSLTLEKSTNDRRMNGFVIQQLKWPTVDFPSYSLNQIATYNPLATIVLQLADFVWPDGSTKTPGDTFVTDNDCPFSDDDVKQSKTGVMIGFCICFSIILIMIVSSVVIWKKYWNFNALPLNYRAPYSQSDLQHIATMVIEFI
jgi:hypothetical protein